MENTYFYVTVNGDLLQAKEELILQQNNCLAVRTSGLAKTITDAYPYADPYKGRKAKENRHIAVDEDQAVPGTIKVFHAPHDDYDGPTFVSLFSQYGTGRPYEDDRDDDHDALHDRVIAVLHGLDHQLAEARIGEDALDEHG